jgi:hypothetical protein
MEILDNREPEVLPAKAKSGRKRFFQPDKVAKLQVLLRKGLSRKGCCQALGCTETTLYEEMRVNPAFAQIVTRTETECEEALLGTILLASQRDWRAAGWMAERRFPDRWGTKPQAQLHAHVHGSAGEFAKLLGAGRSEQSIDIEASEVEAELPNPPQTS